MVSGDQQFLNPPLQGHMTFLPTLMFGKNKSWTSWSCLHALWVYSATWLAD